MTQDQIVAAVAARFNDSTAPFANRILATLPLAIERFCSAIQWEFLDKYANMNIVVDPVDGFSKIEVPSDFFKPVRFWGDNFVLDYIDRDEFARIQLYSSATQQPVKFTLFGRQPVLAQASTESIIHAIYTRTSANFTLPNIPSQYHSCIEAAIVVELTPDIVQTPNGPMANRMAVEAQARYDQRVREAMSNEFASKGKTNELSLDPMHEERSWYR